QPSSRCLAPGAVRPRAGALRLQEQVTTQPAAQAFPEASGSLDTASAAHPTAISAPSALCSPSTAELSCSIHPRTPPSPAIYRRLGRLKRAELQRESGKIYSRRLA